MYLQSCLLSQSDTLAAVMLYMYKPPDNTPNVIEATAMVFVFVRSSASSVTVKELFKSSNSPAFFRATPYKAPSHYSRSNRTIERWFIHACEERFSNDLVAHIDFWCRIRASKSTTKHVPFINKLRAQGMSATSNLYGHILIHLKVFSKLVHLPNTSPLGHSICAKCCP